jgi:outer membrane protein assembly factor BamB
VVAVGVAVVAVRADDGGGSGRGDGDPGGQWVDQRSNPFRMATDADEELVCTAGLDGASDVYCLDIGSGEDRFSVDLDVPASTSPTIAGDMVLVGDDRGGGVHAWSFDGEEVWTKPVRVPSQELNPLPIPVVGDTVVVLDDGPQPTELVGIDLATGEERWRAFEDAEEGRPQVSNFTDVLTDGELVYLTTETRPPLDFSGPTPPGWTLTLHAIDPATGDEAWQWVIAADTQGFPVATAVTAIGEGLAGFVVQSGGSAGRLVVLDTATGEARWEKDLPAADSSVAHVDGVTVVASGKEMWGYDDAGTERWAAPMPDELGLGLGHLVVTEGRLFSTSYDVHEIDPADGTGQLVLDGVSSSDVDIVGDTLLLATMSGLTALPLPPPLP